VPVIQEISSEVHPSLSSEMSIIMQRTFFLEVQPQLDWGQRQHIAVSESSAGFAWGAREGMYDVNLGLTVRHSS